MSFLVDTNVLSELRKGSRCDGGVLRWFEGVGEEELFTSVLVIGELRHGIESIRGRDKRTARVLERWLASLTRDFAERILPIDLQVAERWGEMTAGWQLPVADGLIAATASVHGLTVVTRNSDDFEPSGVEVLSPFNH